ncbi:MAG: dATP/dGTP diphosphohydrolase domain-containing protein [Patescibacteria group bacterium]
MKISCPKCNREVILNKANKLNCSCGHVYKPQIKKEDNNSGVCNMDFKEVKDSGKRQEFNTGSVRDTAEGKGTPHLIAGEALVKYKLNRISDDNDLLPLIEINLLAYSSVVEKREDNIADLYWAVQYTIKYISEISGGSYSAAMRRLAKHYENGSKKYSANNWRKGQPISRYYDSAMRHLWESIDNKIDEDHPAALFWNEIGIIQTKIDIDKGLLPKELDDFPFIISEVFPKKETK